MEGSKGFGTRATRAGLCRDKATGAVSMPIYQTATFSHPGYGQSTGYDYSRTANPTRTAVEEAVADLEGGHRGFGFSTGLAACTAVTMLFSSGDHVILSEDLYGGTFRIFDSILRRFGIGASFVDTTDPDAVRGAIVQGKTKALIVETPSNPMIRITDLRAMAGIAREANLLLIVDNTFMSPYLQRPIELGADIVFHSGTKFLGGHNDTLAGFVVTASQELSEKIFFIQNATGGVLAPFDSWLILRGIKTLPIRMDRQQKTARILAEFLDSHPRVTEVYFPEIIGHPGGDAEETRHHGHAAQALGRAGRSGRPHRRPRVGALGIPGELIDGFAQNVEKFRTCSPSVGRNRLTSDTYRRIMTTCSVSNQSSNHLRRGPDRKP